MSQVRLPSEKMWPKVLSRRMVEHVSRKVTPAVLKIKNRGEAPLETERCFKSWHKSAEKAWTVALLIASGKMQRSQRT